MRLALLLLLALPLAAEPTFAWLAGSWTAQAGQELFEETWLPPIGGSFVGLSRTVSGGRMVFFEYLRIIERNGETYFIAQPNGRPPTEFKLTSSTSTKAVFENPANDFPKVITYELTAPGKLSATISAGEKRQEFRFERQTR